MSAINQKSWILPEVSICTLDMLSQILYYKNQDVGKKCELSFLSIKQVNLLYQSLQSNKIKGFSYAKIYINYSFGWSAVFDPMPIHE